MFWTNSGGTLSRRVSGDGGKTWTGVDYSGITVSTPLSATSWGSARIDLVYGVDANHLGHWWLDNTAGANTTGHESLLSNSQPVGVPIVASAPGHANRLDVFATPAGSRLSHTLYQESLPGFVGVDEGNSGGEGLWCWASAATSAANYLTHPNPSLQSCDGVNKVIQPPTCCTIDPSTGKAPAACLVGGGVEAVLKAYGISYKNVPPLNLADLRSTLWKAHLPAISHHAHADGSGHYVDLVDTYRMHGKDMVVIFGTQFDANWVVPYTNVYLRKYYNWWVDGMIIDLKKK
jgi:hypothetical protein